MSRSDRSPELLVWKAPVPADGAEAEALVRSWRSADVTESSPDPEPFESSDDVTWFSRELTGDAPPIWNPDKPATRAHPDRVMVVPLEGTIAEVRETLAEVFGLATKYDLVVYDPHRRVVHQPRAEMAAYASATFWPRGAIRAAVAGGVGAILAIAAWFVGIPILSGVAIVIGGFLFVMAVYTFVHEGRIALRGDRRNRS
jgi:hypothetical protein